MHGSEAQGFRSWSTNEACLLLKAVQILGLLKLETRVHLAALKPESVSSQTALRGAGGICLRYGAEEVCPDVGSNVHLFPFPSPYLG